MTDPDIRFRIRIATQVRRALAEVCTVPVLLVYTGFWATVCKTVRPMLSDCCLVLSCLSVCNVGELWTINGWMGQGETLKLSMEIGVAVTSCIS